MQVKALRTKKISICAFAWCLATLLIRRREEFLLAFSYVLLLNYTQPVRYCDSACDGIGSQATSCFERQGGGI